MFVVFFNLWRTCVLANVMKTVSDELERMQKEVVFT